MALRAPAPLGGRRVDGAEPPVQPGGAFDGPARARAAAVRQARPRLHRARE